MEAHAAAQEEWMDCSTSEGEQLLSEDEPEPEPAWNPATAMEAKQKGNEFYKQQKYYDAIDCYTKAIEMEPSNPVFLNNRAAARVMIRSFQAALDDALAAIELDGSEPKYLLRAAKCYLSMGRATDALRFYQRVLEIDPTNATATQEVQQLTQIDRFKEQAEVAMENGHYNNVVSLMDRALKLAPSDTKLSLLKAEAYLKLGRTGETDRIAAAILRENSNHTEALYVRGLSLYARGDMEKAEAHFKRALRGNPDHQRSRLQLKAVKKVVREKQEGNVAFKAGRYQEAVDSYTAALGEKVDCPPFNAKLFYNRGLCLSKLGRASEALEDCNAALDADSSYTKALLKRAALQLELEDYEAAVRDYEAAAEQDPSNGDIRSQLHHAKHELKLSKRKDYYKIIGVSKNATDSEIKKAYRKKAMSCHPDRVQGDEAKKDAEIKFKEVGEAYSVLSDPQKKARFDRGEDLEDMQGGGGGFGGMDPSDIFAQMFGGGGMGGGFGGGFPGGHSHGGFHFG